MNLIRQELDSLPATPKDLRKFGLLVGGISLMLGGWFVYRGRAAAPWCLIVGTPLAILGIAAPQKLRLVYRAWMTLAIALGLVVSTALLSLFYFVVMAPIGLIARLAGRDFMQRSFEPTRRTYWSPRSKTTEGPERYERQF